MKKRVTQDDSTAEGKKIPRLYLREVAPTDNDGPYEGIGTDLRAARVETGVDIAGVADNLRISRGYLEAIEDGRFGDLPGGAYVFGFLRSYAEYLELDPKAVIAKYKAESELPRAETKLAFPSPMDQGRLPAGRLLASSLVLAGLVYAGWYAVNAGQRQSAEVVSPVPDRLAALIDNAATSDTAAIRLPGIAAPVQSVTVEPAGPPDDGFISNLTQARTPAALAPQAASTADGQAVGAINDPAATLRRAEADSLAPVRVEEQAAIEVPAVPATRPAIGDPSTTAATNAADRISADKWFNLRTRRL